MTDARASLAADHLEAAQNMGTVTNGNFNSASAPPTPDVRPPQPTESWGGFFKKKVTSLCQLRSVLAQNVSIGASNAGTILASTNGMSVNPRLIATTGAAIGSFGLAHCASNETLKKAASFTSNTSFFYGTACRGIALFGKDTFIADNSIGITAQAATILGSIGFGAAACYEKDRKFPEGYKTRLASTVSSAALACNVTSLYNNFVRFIGYSDEKISQPTREMLTYISFVVLGSTFLLSFCLTRDARSKLTSLASVINNFVIQAGTLSEAIDDQTYAAIGLSAAHVAAFGIASCLQRAPANPSDQKEPLMANGPSMS